MESAWSVAGPASCSRLRTCWTEQPARRARSTVRNERLRVVIASVEPPQPKSPQTVQPDARAYRRRRRHRTRDDARWVLVLRPQRGDGSPRPTGAMCSSTTRPMVTSDAALRHGRNEGLRRRAAFWPGSAGHRAVQQRCTPGGVRSRHRPVRARRRTRGLRGPRPRCKVPPSGPRRSGLVVRRQPRDTASQGAAPARPGSPGCATGMSDGRRAVTLPEADRVARSGTE